MGESGWVLKCVNVKLNISHELTHKLSISSIQGRPFFVKYRQLSPERDRNQHRVFSHHQPLIVLSQQWRTCRDFRPGERQWLIASTSTSSERAYNLLSTVTFYWFPRWSIYLQGHRDSVHSLRGFTPTLYGHWNHWNHFLLCNRSQSVWCQLYYIFSTLMLFGL